LVPCRRSHRPQLLVAAVSANAVFTLSYLAYSGRSAPIIHGLGGLVVMCSELALMDLAVRATPRGCESLGFAIMMSARNFAMKGSDVIGSWLLDSRGWAFADLVWLNAATTALVLVFIPLLPRLLLLGRDGETSVEGAGVGAGPLAQGQARQHEPEVPWPSSASTRARTGNRTSRRSRRASHRAVISPTAGS